MKIFSKKDFIVLCLIFIISTVGILIWYPKFDFDFFNYQFYNGYAFLNNRIDLDFMPAGFRTYWNPYLDAVQYFMAVKLNNHRFLYAVFMNLDTVLGLFLTYKIIDKIILKNILNRNLSLFLILVYVSFSPLMYRVADASRNDMFLSDLFLIAFYIALNLLEEKSPNKMLKACLIGVITGVSVGLKLTGIVYGLTFFLCFIFFFKKLGNPLKFILIYSSSVFLSFLAVNGYWLYLIYSRFKNPFFPVFNDIFHSPYCDFLNFYMSDYSIVKAGNLFQFLFYPFLNSNDFHYGFFMECFDPRYAIFFICLFILPFFYKKSDLKSIVSDENHFFFLILFCFFSFEVNILFFGIYRYITATSLLLGLVLFLTIALKLNKFRNIFFILVLILAMSIQKIPYLNKFFLFSDQKTVLTHVEKENIQDNSTVFVQGSNVAYWVAFQNKNARYVTLENLRFNDYSKDFIQKPNNKYIYINEDFLKIFNKFVFRFFEDKYEPLKIENDTQRKINIFYKLKEKS